MRVTSAIGRAAAAAAAGAVALVTSTLFATPALADIPGRDVVDASTLSTSGNKSVVAECDPGKVVIGTGAWITGGSGEVRITDLSPRTDYVYAAAREDEDGYPYNWTLTVSAICADEDLAGWEIIERVSTEESDPYNSVAAYCTGDKELLGVGYRINDGLGQVGIDDLRPMTAGVSAWAYEDDTGLGSSWSLSVFAICADHLPGHEIVEVVSAPSSNDARSITAECSAGKEIVGGGGQVDGGAGQVILEDLVNESDEYTATAYEDDNGTASNWHMHVYAICAYE